jgi:hypothetical protein
VVDEDILRVNMPETPSDAVLSRVKVDDDPRHDIAVQNLCDVKHRVGRNRSLDGQAQRTIGPEGIEKNKLTLAE